MGLGRLAPGALLSGNRAAFAAIFAATMAGLLAVAAPIAVLPRYVTGPLDSTDFAVGIVGGAFAATALIARPIAGRLADRRGRKLAVLIGLCLEAVGGAMYYLPFDVAGLIAARLVLGAGEGMVFTAGSAWIVDIAPLERRGRMIGLYGLSIWGGLTLGVPLGEGLFQLAGYDAVWGFCAALPALAALALLRVGEPYRPALGAPASWLAPEALLPGLALMLCTVGYAAIAAFIVLHLDAEGIGEGSLVFTVFAATVVLTRLVAGGLPDRVGSGPSALAAAGCEVAGLALVGWAPGLGVVIVGAALMGAGFSTIYPALSLLVVSRVPEHRRGSAIGTLTAFFDAGVGIGSPLAGLAVSIAGGYGAAFFLASVLAGAAMTVLLAAWDRLRPAPLTVPA